MLGHKSTPSVTQNRKAELANAYNELGKELSSTKLRVVGNYTLGRVIGEGAYGKVRLGTHRLTSTRVAIKQIPKAMSASLTREIHHHRQLHHPHITQMYEVIATESHIWIVTELCCGGELFDYLVEKGRLSEDETRVVFGQLCLAVAYLHESGIVHRDLKLENVLLDERCRVKLGDFGFTREFDRNAFMETFCGTTGYASPEMLQGRKYQGPEVDVWSLGIILYTLLTGTLPFDDDDEAIMREKVIQGDFEDPTWLSLESRDLIKNILVKDVSNRLTIPQILSHPWFSTRKLSYEPDSPISILPFSSLERPATPDESRRNSEGTAPDSSEASTQESTSPFMRQPDLASSTPTTPDQEIDDPFESTDNKSTKEPTIQRHGSNSTIRKTSGSDSEPLSSKLSKTGDRKPATVPEEDADKVKYHSPSPLLWSASSKGPPSLPVRTPARTKRRSVSSIMSDAASPTTEKPSTPLPAPSARDIDFMSMLTSNAPVMFSTPNERRLLNTMASLGLDTAQIVHSVLSHACDSAGAMWWMLRKKEDKMVLEDGEHTAMVTSPAELDATVLDRDKLAEELPESESKSKRKRTKVSAGVQTDAYLSPRDRNVAPQFALVPPTPTLPVRPSTPPRAGTPTRSPLLSPSTSTVAGESGRSHPSTPSGSVKDKDKDMGSKGRKARSGSVSIMQRATTALEAAGLVRKKSSEAFKEDREREKSKESDRRMGSNEEPRPSQGSSRLTKSPPLKPSKDGLPPSTPPPSEHMHNQAHIGSPWVLAEGRDATPANPIAALKAEMIHSHSTPNISETAPKQQAVPVRNKSNLLAAFRLWFNEERKGKRKEEGADGTSPPPQVHGHARMPSRRGSNSNTKYTTGRGKHRSQRPSMSSRRSSSVNSRRSSITSAHMVVLESPQLPARRSLGSHTPNSEFGGEHSSRPSSVRSFSMQQRHRKSPSQSSAGSIHLRTSSPMQKFHRRGGSGSSTRVVRQMTPVQRPPHVRSNSATSSLQSPPSSRPTSYYEPSEGEGIGSLNIPRNASPYKSRRRSTDDASSIHSHTQRRNGSGTATFVAQKRQGPFASPAYGGGGGTIGRSSWKKSWGIEPPGWSSRTAHQPLEVIDILPSNEPMSIRDVFSSKQAHSSPGDDSDWVDEDDDIPALAGGLGQMGTSVSSSAMSTGGGGAGPSSSSSSSSSHHHHPLQMEPKPITLSPAPRGHRSKRNNRNAGSSSSVPGGRSKPGHSPASKSSPLPMETPYESTEPRSGRRQLPPGRANTAFKQPIQEEDEDEEEE